MVHFIILVVPRMSATSIITMVKSIIAKEIFKSHHEVKTKLWGGEFWTDGYFVNTVSKFGDETSISKYVRDQGLEKEYTILHKSKN
jgi:REP element-mobilizing transposase RayT